MRMMVNYEGLATANNAHISTRVTTHEPTRLPPSRTASLYHGEGLHKESMPTQKHVNSIKDQDRTAPCVGRRRGTGLNACPGPQQSVLIPSDRWVNGRLGSSDRPVRHRYRRLMDRSGHGRTCRL